MQMPSSCKVCFGSQVGAAGLHFWEFGEPVPGAGRGELLQLCSGPWALEGLQSFLPLLHPFRGGTTNYEVEGR